ncbi:unnamed protein product [Adineta steineri]|uniref:G domain-containing protein n=1 Tax=Adineta steineri TaxID=433720 RepID=A0A813UUS3_9BILA|nr:unnamed protein product [Adineta steineri]
MCRILFVVPTGVGKSTLINILINNNVNEDSMVRPAEVNDTSQGHTSFFITYYDFPNNAYADSIGLGGNRFKPEDVMHSIKLILKNSSVGYNKVYICIQNGRISSDTPRKKPRIRSWNRFRVEPNKSGHRIRSTGILLP